MSGRLAGKIAIVTGGASGIGRATCRLFGREGAAVLVTDVNEAGGRAVGEAVTAAGGRAAFLPLDVTREADWTAAIDHVLREHGRLDVLVNNAGRGGLPARVPAEHVVLADWELIMAANATSVLLGTKHAIPAMRRTGGGAIVNVVSIYALVGSRGGASYHASKGAARALTRAAAIQYASEGIRINAVFPGFVETGMTAELHARPGVREERVALTPLGRVAEPEDVAPGILYLASDEASFVTGTELVIDGGMTAR
ncbi:MAG TPA: glucose 1-dehydrogenase [Methylomirabilota bacterium]|jgi:NAD(P)-dependent dehydrogenase (short-subunit alcohol dehydrogenase family)